MTVTVEVVNSSGEEVAEDDAVALARFVLAGQGIDAGDLGISFVSAEEMRVLKREHLGLDETTDVLAFPIDSSDELPSGLARQLGDVVVCPEVVGDAWRRPLVHGLLHLLGHEHGPKMDALEEALS
jgi:probable rRNA maturation factor